MNQDKYIKMVLKEINCSKKDKLKIKEDLKNDIALSLANNETWEEIDSIDESKIFDETTLNEKVQVVIDCLNADDYDKLMSISDDLMQKSSTREGLNSAIATLGDLGDFKSVTRANFVEVKDQGKLIAVGEIVALYEHKSVTYTISFDEDMKLIGLYMK